MAEKQYQNILIIKMSSLGDILHALPSLYALRRHFPDARITWAVHPAFAGILPGKPWIDEVYIISRKKIRSPAYWRVIHRDLHSRKFDLVIDLQMIAKSALVAFLSGGEEKIGYWEAREGSGFISRPISGPNRNGHIIERLLDVTRYLGCKPDAIEFPLREHEAEKVSVAEKLKDAGVRGKYVLCVPGTRWETKKWPEDHWSGLIRRIVRHRIYVVLSGSREETELGRRIGETAASPFVIDMTGQTSLLELVALEEGAAMHISGDTGPLHIANAVHTSIIALFGPTMPDRSGPYGNRNSDVILADVPCRGCGRSRCREWECMPSILVDQVYALFMKKWEKEQGTFPEMKENI